MTLLSSMSTGENNLDYTLITKTDQLRSCLSGWEDNKCRIIALDLEANLHRYAYGQQLCLVQVFDGRDIMIIDPFDIDRKTLKALFENRDILKVMYDAASDISLLVNSEEMTIKSILDLRPAVELLNYQKNDLYSILSAEMGISLNNKKKFQQYNWLRRPLPEEVLEYAGNDVKHLLRLKDVLMRKIQEKNLLDAYMLKNLRVQNRDYVIDPATTYRRVKGYYGLNAEARTLFKKVYYIRDKYARETNMPAANIIGNKILLDLADGAESVDDLRLPKRLADNLKEVIIRDINQALGEETIGGRWLKPGNMI